MDRHLFPYRVISADAVEWTDPELLVASASAWTPVGREVPGWDPSANLTVRGAVRVDPRRVELDTGLTLGEMALVVAWTSSASRTRSAGSRQPFDPSGGASYQVILPGAEIDGVLEIDLCIVAIPSGAVDIGTANRSGSILARRAHQVALEGNVGMFPVEIIDFARTRLPNKASWYLEMSQDLDQPFLAGYRLQVNKRDAELTSAIGATSPSEREAVLLSELEEGVFGLLLEAAALLQDELMAKEAWEPDTVGFVLKSVLSRLDDPGVYPTSPAELANWRASTTSRVRGAGVGRGVS